MSTVKVLSNSFIKTKRLSSKRPPGKNDVSNSNKNNNNNTKDNKLALDIIKISKHNLPESKSLKDTRNTRGTNPMIDIPMTVKRRSTGSLRRRVSTASSLNKSMDTNTGNGFNKLWRPPGFYEIPNVLGSDCFLKPSDPMPAVYELRQSNPKKNISKRPWLPAGISSDIPQLRPLVRPSNIFERQLRKALPSSVSISCLDPRNKFDNFYEIGTGVNGAVVGATHKYKHWKLAIKRCKLDNDREYRAAIVRELKIMSSGHNNLIRLRDVSMWREEVWMVMDLQQCSVFAVLCQRGLPEQFAVYIANETLKALVYLHSKGIIHRDVKSENLLIGWKGEIKLADFGLATRLNRRNRDRLGTSKWMAPEVIREQYYDEKIDLWSLGITVIEMMDRVPPHYLLKNDKELFATILNEPSPTFSYSYPTMYMRGLVAWLLDENNSNRPSAAEVLQELHTHVESKLLRTSDATEFARFITNVMPSTSCNI